MFRSNNRVTPSIAVAMFFACANAHAQMSKVNSTLSNVQVALAGLAVTIFTIAFLWAAYKMAFQHAKWAEIAHIVYGAIMAGAASGLAAWLAS